MLSQMLIEFLNVLRFLAWRFPFITKRALTGLEGLERRFVHFQGLGKTFLNHIVCGLEMILDFDHGFKGWLLKLVAESARPL